MKWTILGTSYYAEPAIIAEAQIAYEDAVGRNETQPMKFAMQVLVKHHIIEDDRLIKNRTWYPLARAIGHVREERNSGPLQSEEESTTDLPDLFDIPNMIATKIAMNTDLEHVVRDIEYIISRYNIPEKRVLSIISKKLSE